MIADAVIERAQTAELSSRVIDRAFHVLARPEIHLAPSKLSALLERIFALAQDEDRQKAYRVAACMANNDMSRVSEAAERSRTVAWGASRVVSADRMDGPCLPFP